MPLYIWQDVWVPASPGLLPECRWIAFIRSSSVLQILMLQISAIDSLTTQDKNWTYSRFNILLAPKATKAAVLLLFCKLPCFIEANSYRLRLRPGMGKLGPGGRTWPVKAFNPACRTRINYIKPCWCFIFQFSHFPTTPDTLTFVRCGVLLHVCALLFDPLALLERWCLVWAFLTETVVVLWLLCHEVC